MKKVLLTLMIALSVPLAANAQSWNSSASITQKTETGQKAAMVQKLYELSQDVLSEKIVPVRGGTKEKPLGIYLGGKDTNMEFKSGYKDVDARTQCEWAYDLHKFVVDNGGGIENYRKYQREAKPDTISNDSLRSYAGGKDPTDPMDRAHVPYDKQAAFADTWWKNNSQAYKKSVFPPKDWWTNDAILDGNNLWTRYEQLNGQGSADFVGWRDVDLIQLLHKK